METTETNKTEKSPSVLGRLYLSLMNLLFIASLVTFFLSLFIGIWGDSELAWKIFLTSILVAFITMPLYYGADKKNKKKEVKTYPKSEFQKKLEEMAKKRGVDLNN